MFFLPLRLLFVNSSRPKIASRASAVVNVLKLAMSDPGLFFITCSNGTSFGGVLKGGGGILCAVDMPLAWPLPLLLRPVVSNSVSLLNVLDVM